ncbi:MAG: hypothetical protein OEM49_00295 [Myxococcales bacterium]|nr:hypothetical protein [Myxococcales bacterium]MDH5305933.1 hypothetical protein [Myxococcales bacterium]MDH5567043.1 hypothetical protein [Myxococcales bacterium]
MAIPKRGEYLSALRELEPNVYKFGERIDDVTTQPATRRTVESHALACDAADDSELADLYTTTSTLSGETIARWNSLMRSAEDLIGNMRVKRQNFRRCGTCTGAICVGWNAQNVMWAVTHDMDRALGTDDQRRLERWILSAERRGLTVAGALTDAEGDRSLKPSQQPDPDTLLRVTEVRDDGIVLRGAGDLPAARRRLR